MMASRLRALALFASAAAVTGIALVSILAMLPEPVSVAARARPDGGALASKLASFDDVPEALKGPLIARLNELAMSTDPTIGAREKISAAKALLLADKLGLESIRTAIVADNHDGVVERLRAIERQLDAKEEGRDEDGDQDLEGERRS